MSRIPAGYLSYSEAKAQKSAYISKGADQNKDTWVTHAEVVSALRKQFIFKGLTELNSMADQLFSDLGLSKSESVSVAAFQQKCSEFAATETTTSKTIDALGMAGIGESRHSKRVGSGKGSHILYYFDTPTAVIQ